MTERQPAPGPPSSFRGVRLDAIDIVPDSCTPQEPAIPIPAFLSQLAVSGVAVLVIVALAAAARLARPNPPLDEAAARARLADDFPEAQIDRVWLAADGAAALARSGSRALYLFRLGDAWVARDLAWSDVASAPVRGGRLHLRLSDVSPRLARPVLAGWSPEAA
jgi:hypothetical protein